jgi:hypothetical protein
MHGLWKRAARALLCCSLLAAAAVAPARAEARDFGATRPSSEAKLVVDWVLRTQDHGGRPFAVVDKRLAKVYVFDAQGLLAGHSAALLGSTWGDHTVPGVGERAQTGSVRADERTTPAGRFESLPGRNDKGEHVVWVDYESAFAIHRVRPDRAQVPRERRLATMTPDDNRVSYGCVVVPVAFYERVVEPVLGAKRGVVYVLPETRPTHEIFRALEAQL